MYNLLRKVTAQSANRRNFENNAKDWAELELS
jgi:hypothetical protein